MVSFWIILLSLPVSGTPQGKLPILEVDGRVLCQTGAIVRYIAREYGLYGKDNVENTQVDIVLDTAEDMTPEIIKLAYENDPDKKKEYMQNFTGIVIPNFVRLFCNILCQNGDGNGWMVGSTLTVADLCVFGLFNSLEGGYGPDAVQALYNDAKLKALYDRVAQVEEIKQWLEKRPKSF
ncbi:glutathione S-transferase-like isoform X2 [Argopecten irradians]|uniref:glutathione S-transferase-like isoform X2 n=1 Tax=Argopecten irradians TaxID=31199 RepID=UPI0037133002